MTQPKSKNPILFHGPSGEPIHIGGVYTTRRGQPVRVLAVCRPDKPGTAGMVITDRGEFFPSTIKAEWRELPPVTISLSDLLAGVLGAAILIIFIIIMLAFGLPH